MGASDMASTAGLTIGPLKPGFGAEISGVDLSRPLDPDVFAALAKAFSTQGVTVVHSIAPLSNEQHIELSRALGPLGRVSTTIAGDVKPRIPYPEITDVSNLGPDGRLLPPDSRRAMFQRGDRLWHTDYSFVENRATLSLLSANIVPPSGGDTEFADMRSAYDALPALMKARIEGLIAEHCIWYSRQLAGYPEPTAEELRSRPAVHHPLVQIHPATGRRSLYLASHASHIVGMPIEEGRVLLAELTAFATQPEFVYRHKWRYGDLVVWDNLCTMHRATEYDSSQFVRDMRRTTLREHALN